MNASILERLRTDLAALRGAGLYKAERVISTPQGGVIRTGDAEVINLCANNYLGLANHPAINTVRSYNCLKREGIHTVGELVGRSEQDLLDIRNFGAKSIEEVKQKLIDMGLSLKDSPPGFDPSSAVGAYGDDDESYVETEQY